MKTRLSVYAATLALLVAAAHATTVVPIPIEELASRASLVVEGRAVEQWSQWDAEHRLIYTYTRFSIAQTLKGATQSTLVVRQMGGSAGGYTQKVSGVRHWMPGEEAVLFLRPSVASDSTMSVVGLMQGNFRVYRTSAGAATVSNGVPDASELSSGRSFSGARLPLVELEQRVRKAVSQ